MSDDRDDERAQREARRLERDAEARTREREARELEQEAESYEQEAEKLGREAEELARIKAELERVRAQEAKALEREGKELEREAKQLERIKEELERTHEHDHEADNRAHEHEAERRKQQHEREREAEKRRREHEHETDKREREREREAEKRGREHEREAEKRERERRAEERKRDGATAHEASSGGADQGRGDDDGPWGGDSWWTRRDERQWTRVERAWRRHMEQRARWETRRAEHRARWKKRRRRWKELHEEREMWMRMRKDGRAWGPWWLQARMRRRIFSWLAVAFVSGAMMTYYWDAWHWWHAVVVLIGLSVVSGMIAFGLTRPLSMVIRVAQDIGDGKLETRLDVESHRGETRLLAIAINDMAERIEQQLKDQRQLLAAVSHELRTPLGHMRVLIDTARDAADRSALAELEREVLVLDDLVGRLLASSRLEFGNLDCRPLDLGALVSDVATAAGVAPEALEAIGDVRASVDPTLIRRAVANLLDNARVHGGGAVAVRIERRARQVAIEVDDAGPGVPADRRADAFRAFVPSRAGGLGLGLALVSRIAVAHGGGAWITDRPGGGARVGFTVEIAPSAG